MAKEAAKRKRDEEEAPEEAPQQASTKGRLRGMLLWGGYFLISTTIILGVAVVLAQRKRAVRPAEPHVVADTLRTAALAHADSLVLSPEDSLKTQIQDLQVAIRQREDSLHKAVDTTSRMQTRLERLEAELDTLRQREVLLSNAEVIRLSRVFESMQPRKAAPVLLRMDNASVAAILLMIDERTAAKMLAAMPPDRAAGIGTLIREQAREKARRAKAKS